MIQMLTSVLSALSFRVVDTESIKGRRGGHWSRLALRLAIELDEKLDEKLDGSVKNNY